MPESCPCCGGVSARLGALGALEWHRCIDCGATFNVLAEPEDARIEEIELELERAELDPTHPWHSDELEPHPFDSDPEDRP